MRQGEAARKLKKNEAQGILACPKRAQKSRQEALQAIFAAWTIENPLTRSRRLVQQIGGVSQLRGSDTPILRQKDGKNDRVSNPF